MSSLSWLLFAMFCLSSATSLVSGLKCYECSNLQDPRCGTTFGYPKGSKEAEGFLKTCTGDVTVCRKLEYQDSLQGANTGGVVVTRSCWKSPGEEGYRPQQACTKMFSGKVCYCSGQSCNGSKLFRASATLVVLGLFPFIFKSLIS